MRALHNLFKIAAFGGMLLAMVLTGCQQSGKTAEPTEDQIPDENRIITFNGALSETVYALGKGKSLVGRDVTGVYPAYVRDSVKDLGHVRSISIESVLSLRPTMILALKGDLNPDLEAAIKNTNIDFHIFNPATSVEEVKHLIDEVGEITGVSETELIHQKIDRDLKEIKEFPRKPKVLFVYARGAGTLMIAGENTSMQTIIELAGAENAVQGITNFKPLTEEALLNADPDAVLLFDTGLESLGGKKGFLKAAPALSQTRAGANLAFITMDGGLLSELGPRTGEAVQTLNRLLIPYAE